MEKGARICVWLLGHQETTQAEAARALGVSLSTVNNLVKKLERMGAVRIGARRLEVVDAEKVLIHLANVRDVGADIIYSTRVDASVGGIEKSMPPGAVFTAYSAYKFKYREVPADYSEVYVYADGDALAEIRKRFPPRKGPPNLFVLRMEFKDAPDALVFADLWNLREWYAKEFVRGLRGRILA